jgi:hypothetical protein
LAFFYAIPYNGAMARSQSRTPSLAGGYSC